MWLGLAYFLEVERGDPGDEVDDQLGSVVYIQLVYTKTVDSVERAR